MAVLMKTGWLLGLLPLIGCGDNIGLVIDYAERETASTPGSDTDTGSDTGSGGDIQTVPFILGADISWVQEQEDLGVVFTEDGAEKDILEILKDHGFNTIRLRIFSDPGQPDGYQFAWTTRAEPYCDLSHTIEMAERVKDAGMGLYLNFHYSDTWADPGAQNKPAAWVDLDFESLKRALYTYTRDVLGAFRAASALPDMVQLGNEITPGMLFPDGANYDADHWDQLAELLIAATDAVEEVNPNIRTVIHLDQGDDNDTTVWWVDEALARGVKFDILAQSTYTEWQGMPDAWEANFADLAARYPHLSFIVAEYAEDADETVDVIRRVNDIIWNTPRGLGTFIWEPTADGEWGVGLFDMPTGAGEATPRESLLVFDELADAYGL